MKIIKINKANDFEEFKSCIGMQYYCSRCKSTLELEGSDLVLTSKSRRWHQYDYIPQYTYYHSKCPVCNEEIKLKQIKNGLQQEEKSEK